MTIPSTEQFLDCKPDGWDCIKFMKAGGKLTTAQFLDCKPGSFSSIKFIKLGLT